MKNIYSINDLPELDTTNLHEICEMYPFKASEYYLSLVDWEDEKDPIRKIIIPSEREFKGKDGVLDASSEKLYTVLPGCEHKYPDTAVLLISKTCAGFCRFCFRKRLFMKDNVEVVENIDRAIQYIWDHPEINNVLLTGGDPFAMDLDKLGSILEKLDNIIHLRFIRIGTKVPAYNPHIILENELKINRMLGGRAAKIYVVVHFSHPVEVTDRAVESVEVLKWAGCSILNQTTFVKGVNDDPQILAQLFTDLTEEGIPPYYVFIMRPVTGNKLYAIPVERAYEIFERARNRISGVAKRARLIMSHKSGKIQILGISPEEIYMKMYRSPDPEKNGKIFVFKRNPEAYWFNDYLSD